MASNCRLGQFLLWPVLSLILAIPEHSVSLPSRGKQSQNDLFVLAKTGDGQLLAIMVEGKVAETFGATLGAWLSQDKQGGKAKRLAFLHAQLDLPAPLPLDTPYQLLHRSVSAISEARRFNAPRAMLLIHSFSQTHQRFDHYARFIALFGRQARHGQIIPLQSLAGIELYAGWVVGEKTSQLSPV